MREDDAMDDDRDRVLRIIMARCPELSDADLVLISAIHPDPARVEPSAGMSPEIGAQILRALDHVSDRLDRLAETVGVTEDDDGDATERR
jgi:hypothetical protein